MRIRVVISGIVSGGIGYVFLRLLFYNIRLGRTVPGWPSAELVASLPSWVDYALIGLTAFVVFVFGWVAARWNWSRDWQSSLLSGAGSGLIAGSLVYCLVGTFQAGLDGQIEILQSLSRAVTEDEGTLLLVDGVIKTAVTTYTYFVIYLIAATLLGGLGGLLSALDKEDVWGKPVPPQDPWLHRLPAYSLTLTAAINILITLAIFQLLDESLTNVATEKSLFADLKYPPSFVLWLGYLAGIFILCLPLGMTWGWNLRDWIVQRKRGFLSALWFLSTLGFVIYEIINTLDLENINAYLEWFSLPFNPLSAITVVFAFVLLLVGALAGWVTEPAPESEWTRYRFSDWLGYALANAILGGTQVVAGAVAFSLSIVLITINDIPHLISNDRPEMPLLEQVYTLHKLQWQSALGIMAAGFVGAFLLAVIVAGVRGIFRIGRKSKIQPQPDTSIVQ